VPGCWLADLELDEDGAAQQQQAGNADAVSGSVLLMGADVQQKIQ